MLRRKFIQCAEAINSIRSIFILCTSFLLLTMSLCNAHNVACTMTVLYTLMLDCFAQYTDHEMVCVTLRLIPVFIMHKQKSVKNCEQTVY